MLGGRANSMVVQAVKCERPRDCLLRPCEIVVEAAKILVEVLAMSTRAVRVYRLISVKG